MHDDPHARVLRALLAAERGELRCVHIPEAAIAAAADAGLVTGVRRARLTAKGRAAALAGRAAADTNRTTARGNTPSLLC